MWGSPWKATNVGVNPGTKPEQEVGAPAREPVSILEPVSPGARWEHPGGRVTGHDGASMDTHGLDTSRSDGSTDYNGKTLRWDPQESPEDMTITGSGFREQEREQAPGGRGGGGTSEELEDMAMCQGALSPKKGRRGKKGGRSFGRCN